MRLSDVTYGRDAFILDLSQPEKAREEFIRRSTQNAKDMGGRAIDPAEFDRFLEIVKNVSMSLSPDHSFKMTSGGILLGRNYPGVRLDDSLSGEWKVSKDTLMFQLKAGIGAFSFSQSFRLVSVTSREMRLQNFTTHTHEGVQEYTFKRQ